MRNEPPMRRKDSNPRYTPNDIFGRKRSLLCWWLRRIVRNIESLLPNRDNPGNWLEGLKPNQFHCRNSPKSVEKTIIK